jgi:hypothetical protein
VPIPFGTRNGLSVAVLLITIGAVYKVPEVSLGSVPSVV